MFPIRQASAAGILIALSVVVLTAYTTARRIAHERARPDPPQSVAFRTCVIDNAWTRPTEEQRRAILSDARYDALSPSELYALERDFWPAYRNPHLNEAFVTLSGLGSYPEPNTVECNQSRPAASVELWTLEHEVLEISKTGGGFTVTVRPIENGFRVVQFDLGHGYGPNIVVTRSDGEVLSCFATRGGDGCLQPDYAGQR